MLKVCSILLVFYFEEYFGFALISRYRHEVIYDRGKLLMFGGGAGVNHTAFSLDKVSTCKQKYLQCSFLVK